VTVYRLRQATATDAEAICRIYNQGIEDRVATLETELRTPDERRQWLESRDARHPVIVAEFVVAGAADDSSGPVGWASLNVFNAREAYRFVADISVYVERGWRGKGVGRALLERLTELGRQGSRLLVDRAGVVLRPDRERLLSRDGPGVELLCQLDDRVGLSSSTRCGRHRTRIVTTTDMPARSVCGLPIPFPSRWILTGTRWTTFTQLPVAFSGGRSEKRAPVPALIDSIVPV